MNNAQSSGHLPNWMFRCYQMALAVIALIYALILASLIPGFFVSFGRGMMVLGAMFLLFLAPGSFSVALAIGLFLVGQRPGPVAFGFTVLAAIWSVFAFNMLEMI